MIIIHYITYQFKSALRQIYWLYRLSKARFGKGVQLQFPLIIEGKGKIEFGNEAHIQRKVNLGIHQGTSLVMGNKCLLETKSTILVGQAASLTTGDQFKLGANARLYIQNHWQFGDEVKIETHCVIFAREQDKAGKLTIGNGTHIGDFTIIDMVDDVVIGNEVAIGPNCTLYTHDHVYTDPNKPAWKGGLTSQPIHIKDGAWVGSNVTILPGVSIGEKAVVAAGSVVTKSLEGHAIYGGIPAKLIKRI